MANDTKALPAPATAEGNPPPAPASSLKKEQPAQKKTSSSQYSTRQQAVGNAAYTAQRVLSYPHSHAVMRMGNTVLLIALAITTLCLVVVSANYIRVTANIDTRPIYLKDEDGVTYRLRKLAPQERTKYMRDQIEEFVMLTLNGLYAYNPESQPQIDLMGNLVRPDILTTMKEWYEKRKALIFSKREIRTVSINAVRITTLDEDRKFATVTVQGSIIINSFRVNQAFPIEWNLLIELQPDIKSGLNVYGLVLLKMSENQENQQ